MYKKLKSLIADDLVFTSILLCCVGVVAFMLGRASVDVVAGRAAQEATAVRPMVSVPVSATPPVAAALVTSPPGVNVATTTSQPIVASQSGTKYHLTTCPGAKQIKEENRIYFASPAEAEAAGYSKAANCPGL